MRRRAFLAMLGAVAFDPERLLWLPGQKTIFVPKSVTAGPVGDWWWPSVQVGRDCRLFVNGEEYVRSLPDGPAFTITVNI